VALAVQATFALEIIASGGRIDPLAPQSDSCFDFSSVAEKTGLRRDADTGPLQFVQPG
jgi:hypothetical protein